MCIPYNRKRYTTWKDYSFDFQKANASNSTSNPQKEYYDLFIYNSVHEYFDNDPML